MKCFLTSLLLCFSLFVNANTLAEKTASISGKVIDVDTKVGVEFATIALHSTADSSLVSGVISSGDGAFTLDKVPAGNYFLRIGFIGYKSFEKKDITLTKGQNLNLNTITLKANALQLQEAVVTGEKNLYESKIDKKVFNVEKSAAAVGGTGLDAMNEVPSVEVDSEDNISLRGQENVRIFIDGRPSAIPAAQLLKQIPATSIEKIEVVTNPSAKYDPEGMSGIINVVLKKQDNRGVNGYLQSNVGYGQRWKTSHTLGGNIRQNKINISANGSYNLRNSISTGDSRNTLLPLYDRFNDEVSERESNSYSGKLGIDFYASDYTTLYASGSLNNNNSVDSRENLYQILPDSSFTRLSYKTGTRASYNANIGVQHKFKNKDGHTLDWDLNFGSNERPESNNLDDLYYSDVNYTNLVSEASFIQEPYRKNSNLISKLDYALPINDSLKVEAGFHTTIDEQDARQFLANKDLLTSTFIPDSNFIDSLDYKRTVYAVYTTVSKQYKKLGLMAGLRVEQTNTNSELASSLATSYTANYLSFFPSAHASYQVNPTTSWMLSASRRINRPRTGQLNPFADQSDPLTIFSGSSDLKPEFVNVYEFGFSKFLDKWNVNASVYYRDINGKINRFLEQQGTVNNISYINYAGAEIHGTEASIGYNPKKWLRNTISGNYWSSVTDPGPAAEGIDNANLKTSGYSFRVNSTQTFKGWMFQESFSYRGSMKVLQGKIAQRWNADFTLRKQLWDKKGSIGVRVSDIFNTNQFTITSDDTYAAYTFKRKWKWESRVVYLSFSYNFGKQLENTPRKRKSSNNSGDSFNTGGGM